MLGPATRAAREAREDLGLRSDEPLADILVAVEEHGGVPVTVADLPRDFAGVAHFDAGRAFIFVNGTDPLVRQRFTLAHEFGHVRLGHGTVYDTYSVMWGPDPDEVAANEFAGEFLLPRAAVDKWLERADDPTVDLDVVVRLARAFGVSADVARIRLEKAGRLRPGKSRKAIKDAIALGDHTRRHAQLALGEFADTLTVVRAEGGLPRLPRVVSAQLRAVYAAGLADSDELARRTHQDPQRLAEELADIDVPEDDDIF